MSDYMKKIGLAVCYDTKNYGSQLQVLATIKIIEEMGFDPIIIRYEKKLTPVFIAQTIPRFFNISFLQNKYRIWKKNQEIKRHQNVLEQVKKRNKKFTDFVQEQFLPYFSHPYNGWEKLVKESATDFDIFLCGSDQLWLPFNLGSHFYTLEFAPKNKRKISYATSFGVSVIPKFQRKGTAKYLNRFYALSTREQSGQKIIYDLTSKKAEVVCDPTLLFDADGWKKLLPCQSVIDEPYMMCFFLGDNKTHREVALKLQHETGLKIVSCPFLDNYVEVDEQFGDYQMYEASASDFVNLIRNAEYILTDSFHCSVFSILHHKKFMTFNRFNDGSNSRNSRIDSLCNLLELHERRFNGNILEIDKDIDYITVEEKLRNLRKASLNYLRESLE